jgi:hypothetical protein
MKRIANILILFISFYGFCQTTPIPDPVFENTLISMGIDTNGFTGDILNTDAQGVINLNVGSSGISDLSGIEAFVDLVMLDCESNLLTDLDLTFNTVLEILDCNDNQITSLNVTSNSMLVSLNCTENELPSLDVSNNLLLSDLSCIDNQLTSLDLTNNSNLYQIIGHDNLLTSITFPLTPNLLEIVWLYNNQLVNIDLTNIPTLATIRFENNQLETLDLRNGNNINMHTMDSRNNPDLELICVDDIGYSSSAPLWTKDATSTYTETCVLGATQFSEGKTIIYPNPVHDFAYLNIPDTSKIKSLELHTLLGQSHSLPVSEVLDLSPFSIGLYLLKITSTLNEVSIYKIMKR